MSFSNEHLTRQLDIIPIDVLGEPITIIGAGAIGSWVTLALAKMGFANLTVYDHDKVDTVNLNSQFYPTHAVGEPKVYALGFMVETFTGVKIDAHPYKYETGLRPGIVISAVDNMAVRKLIWDNHANKAPFTRAIIDPRMGAESALLYVMSPMSDKDRESYARALYSDASAVPERCTAKATIYTANILSGLVCKAVKDLLTRRDYLRYATYDIAQDDLTAFRKKI